MWGMPKTLKNEWKRVHSEERKKRGKRRKERVNRGAEFQSYCKRKMNWHRVQDFKKKKRKGGTGKDTRKDG